CNGTTGVMYEGTPDFPDKDRWWAIAERYGVDVLYTAPTAIRAHMKWGAEYAQRHDLSKLRLLGTVGEPINPEAWVWYREHIGADRTPIVDTWWQTETGMILITPLPGVTTLKPGSATRPFPGVDAAVYDEQGNEVGRGGGGLRPHRSAHGPGDRRLRDAAGRRGGLGRDARRASRPRRQGDRPDRETGEHRLHARVAEDEEREDHATAPARRRREPPA